MNKEQLLAKINNIPIFEMRDVALKQYNTTVTGGAIIEGETPETWIEHKRSKAITERGSNEPLAFVSNRYVLIQFREFFSPIVNDIEGDFDGDLDYFHGFAIMDIFPKSEEYQLDGNSVGIVAYNSVDKTSALNIKFCVGYGSRILTIPSKIANFKKMHLGSVKSMTQDYISMILKVKGSWNTIVNQFSQHIIKEEELKDYAENFGIDDRYMKKFKKLFKEEYNVNLWDFCMGVFDQLSLRNYKSEIHKRKRLDKFVQNIFDYGLVMEI